MVGHIRDRVFVAPVDIGGNLLVDTQPYGCFITFLPFLCPKGGGASSCHMGLFTRGFVDFQYSNAFSTVSFLVFRFRKTLLGARPKPHGKVACKLVVYKCKLAVYKCAVYIVNWQWVVIHCKLAMGGLHCKLAMGSLHCKLAMCGLQNLFAFAIAFAVWKRGIRCRAV